MPVMRAAGAFVLAAASVSGWVVPSRPQLDHLVVAIGSLSEGIAQFQALTGVAPVVGGKHPGRGTENALVSLGGGSYLEILAPQAGAQLSADDEPLRALTRLTIVDWAVSVPDVDGAIAALTSAGFTTSPPKPGARLTPAGERLDWMTFGLSAASIDSAPFVIRWSPNTRHPSTTTPGGCALDGITVHDPSADRLTKMLHALDVSGVTVAEGAAAIEAALTCGSKRALLTSASSK
jgi:hypothetical protein